MHKEHLIPQRVNDVIKFTTKVRTRKVTGGNTEGEEEIVINTHTRSRTEYSELTQFSFL